MEIDNKSFPLIPVHDEILNIEVDEKNYVT
jgi:hypothetical protein